MLDIGIYEATGDTQGKVMRRVGEEECNSALYYRKPSNATGSCDVVLYDPSTGTEQARISLSGGAASDRYKTDLTPYYRVDIENTVGDLGDGVSVFLD